jgi:hypothetical protein
VRQGVKVLVNVQTGMEASGSGDPREANGEVISTAQDTDTPRHALIKYVVVRNVGIATAIAVTALGRVEFAVFATAYFLAQVPLLAAVLVFRCMRAGDGSNLTGASRL